MQIPSLKAQSMVCKIQAIGLSFFIICQVAVAQSRPVGVPAGDSIEVGDIIFDSSIDDPAFRVCDAHRVLQYYNTGSYFLDHKKEISRYFISHYKVGGDTANQTGYLTIRFIINCSGETGRFRLYELDSAYQSFWFNKAVSGQLLTLVRQYKGWQPATYRGRVYDSYQYITFRLKKGRIVCITP